MVQTLRFTGPDNPFLVQLFYIVRSEGAVAMRMTVGIVVFPEFEILDVFGPVEMLGMHPETFELRMVAESRGSVSSAQGPRCVVDDGFVDDTDYDVILVPGGQGTRREVDNVSMLRWLERRCSKARFVTSVCTGAALLARTGVLDGRQATTNKMNFEWVVSQGPHVHWKHDARWVEDGNIFTSSGVSAGMDMTLAFIARTLGEQSADDAALWAEYSWHRDADIDPFADAWRAR